MSTENELVRNVLLAVLASLAKLEREKISQRMKAGLETSDREKLRKPLDTGVALSLSYVSESEAGTKANPERDGRSAGGEWIPTSGSAMRSLIANSAALVEAA